MTPTTPATTTNDVEVHDPQVLAQARALLDACGSGPVSDGAEHGHGYGFDHASEHG